MPQAGRPRIRLDEESLFAAARELSGLEDLGDEGFRTPLREIIRVLHEENLTPGTQATAFDVIRDLLVERLRLVDDRKRHPGIREERIDGPIMVMGAGRSGTTFLHALLAADPRSRAPRYWEAMHPSPPPGATAPKDGRVAQATQEMEAFYAKVPGMFPAHPYWDQGGLSLAECERLCVLDFRRYMPSAYWRIPVSRQWHLDADARATYAFHRMMLQHLQWRSPPKRWALKGTHHHTRIDALREAYPDAMLLWIHRDPVQVMASMAEYQSIIKEGIMGWADRREMAAEQLASAREYCRATLGNPYARNDDVVLNVRYPELVKDPVDAVRRIYRHFDLPFSEEYESQLRAWLSAPENQSDRHGKFRYSLEPFGMTADELAFEFREYRQALGLGE